MKRNLLTSTQVALRLGVELSTVYAYVSRGVLTRTLADDGRTSRFDPAEIDALARRGRPRKGAARVGGIDVSLATAITRVEGSRLSYRGRDATELAGTASFEQVAELLWTGALPEVASFSFPEDAAPVLRALAKAMPAASGPLDRFAAAAAATAPLVPLRVDLQPSSVRAQARRLLATFVESLPLLDRRARRSSCAGASIAERLWPRLSPLAPRAATTQLLDAALVLLADHELATSTMAARVAASTRANPFAVVLAGLGALNGPLHGSAALGCHRLLAEAAGSAPEPAVARALAGGPLAGFGHPVYHGDDPRAVHLLERVRAIASRKERAVIDGVIAAAVTVAGARPNVDFGLAAAAHVTDMPFGSTEAIFALARTAGWIAHALEEYTEPPLRFRARAIFVGGPGRV
ncbi:MAG TPA: citrate synthase [Labilithrix sp.]|nr:citrate synthase [Labilithrix sp.]